MNRSERRKIQRQFTKAQRKQIKRERASTSTSSAALIQVMSEYSFEDIWRFIFTSDLWLPNLAGSVKLQYFTAAFLAQPITHFKPARSVNSYETFVELYKRIISQLPDLPRVEDYVPEADWGQVKYHFEGRNYDVLYGCELAALPDHFTAFELIYLGFDSNYKSEVGRSPAEELREVLRTHHNLVHAITTQPKIAPIGTLQPGKLELPSEDFWNEVSNYVDSEKFELEMSATLQKSFSIVPGALSQSILDSEEFQNGIMAGKHLEFMFVSYEDKYLPLLPRRFAPVLIDAWGEIYREVGINFKDHGMRYSMSIIGGLSRFLRDRIDEKNLYPLINVFKESGEHHETVFAAGIQAKNKLLLIYVADPEISLQQWEADLNAFLPKIREAVRLASGPPVRINLNLEKNGIEFTNSENADPIVVLPIIVVPQTKVVIGISIPEPLQHLTFFLEQFVGLIDESADTDEISDFLDFLLEYGDTMAVSERITPMDKMFEYRRSNGVLVPGIRNPSLVIGNFHGGSHLRFESLLKFWQDFPAGAWGVPRGWKIKREENGHTFLSSRRMRLIALAAKAGNSSFMISFPIEEFDFEQAQLCNFLAEMIQDGLETKSSIISDLKALRQFPKVQVLIFPKTILKLEKFDHLKHMENFEGSWTMDVGWPANNEPGIRVVFDEERLQTAFGNVENASFEIEILKDLLSQLNTVLPCPHLDDLLAKLDSHKNARPRFRLAAQQAIVIAPRVIPFATPQLSDYKLARKRLAGMAHSLGIKAGTYGPAEAREILNKLREIAVKDINEHVETLSYKTSLQFLIKQIEGLRQKESFAKHRAAMAKDHEVDYDIPSNRFADHQDFISNHRNFRYLIEKFVQLMPTGDMALTLDRFKFLIAQVDWLTTIYQASDFIHYDIEPASVTFDEDFVIEITHNPDFGSRHQAFGEHETSLNLELIGRPDDRLNRTKTGDDIVRLLNEAMATDLEFTYEQLVYVATALAQWPHFQSMAPSAVYSATLDEILGVLQTKLSDVPTNAVQKVIEFLILRTRQMLQILDDPNPAPDLPVWEHLKRPARYNLRPILECDGLLYWGPHSVYSSMQLWADAFRTGNSPVKLDAKMLNKLIEQRKEEFEDLLEEKTTEIAKRFTTYAQRNVKLHTLKKNAGFPLELGDFDSLAYFPENKLLISFEAKHLREAYCAKDADRLRKKVFGAPDGKEAYITKIERRHAYLTQNWHKALDALSWPTVGINDLKVRSVYVAQRSYWWTMFPPEECCAEFTVIELLDDLIKRYLDQ